jgi:translation initiation factor IF-2
MMIKYRVHEVAKDFGEDNNKKVIDILSKYTGETKKHMTALTEEELNIVFEAFTQTTAVENFDSFFQMAEEAKAAKKAEKDAKKADMLAQQAAIAELLKNGGKPAEAKAENKGGKGEKAEKAEKE